MTAPRRLPFELQHPLVVGAEATEGNVEHIVPPFPNDPNQRIIIKMELSLNEYVQLASAIDAGRDIAYGELSENIWWLWIKAMKGAIVNVVSSMGTETPLLHGLTSVSGFSADCDNEDCEEEMACPKIINSGGKYYLYDDCAGCDKPLWFALTQVSIGSDGSPVAVGDGGETSITDYGFDGVSSEKASCYAESAVPYLLQRAHDFNVALLDWVSLGADAFTNWDEAAEVALLITKMIFGTPDLDEIQALSEAQIDTAFADVAFVDKMKAAWVFSGTVTRDLLRQWVAKSPSIVAATPMRVMLDTWVSFSTIAFYNDKLAEFAAECESAPVTPPPLFDWEWGRAYDFLVSQDTWTAAPGSSTSYTVGVGYGSGPSSATNYFARIEKAGFGQTLTGIKVTLSVAFAGNLNTIFVAAGSTGEVVVQEQHFGESVLEFALDNWIPSTGTLHVGIQEKVYTNSAADDMAIKITSVELYGVGTPPTGGTVINP